MTNKELPVSEKIIEFIPAIRMLASGNGLKTLRLRHNKFNEPFCKSRESLEQMLAKNNTHDKVLREVKFIFIEDTSSPEIIINEFISKRDMLKKNKQILPAIIVLKNYGFLGIGNNSKDAEAAIEEFESLLKEKSKPDNAHLSSRIRPDKHLNDTKNPIADKVCIVTGGAQGFGEGISRSLISDKANLVIADLNQEKGLETLKALEPLCSDNGIAFIKTDVSNPGSVKNLIVETVKNFGGIDIFISNAGILRAGGLDEMEPATFELMTKINYEGYFLCAKYASAVMKLQSKYKEEYYADIIQINSKSGLKGSNRNFAYSGGKFGGIGLTQSFALELAPYRIKVNSVCPGNFFEGPLWSDPKTGLFMQYLKAGKVPGAKTIEDVKCFYEKQVPLGRGCRVQDVMKAVLYIVSQEYETGQAIPVTGGQVMVN